MKISKEQATKRLTNRYNEQAFKFPTMRQYVTVEGYIAANIAHVMRKGSLAEYEVAQ